MANKKWNELEQGAKRRRSNQGTRGTTQPAASNPNKNRKSTDTNRNNSRPAAKPAPKAAPKQNKPKTVYYSNKNKGVKGAGQAAANAIAKNPRAQAAAKDTAGRARVRLANQTGAQRFVTGRDIPTVMNKPKTFQQTVTPLEQVKADSLTGPRYWGSRAVAPSKKLTAEQQKKKNQQTAKQSGFNARARKQTLSSYDQKLSQGKQFQIQQAKQRYDEAKAKGDKAGMEKAHREAERLRYTSGYSGGATGNERIAPKLSQDDYNRLNASGRLAMTQARMTRNRATAEDEIARADRRIEEILNAPGYQNRGRDINTARGMRETAEGRSTMLGATREQREKDAEGLKNATLAGIHLGAGGAGHWLEATDWTIANRNRDQNMAKWLQDADDYEAARSDLEYYDNYVQTFGEPPAGMNRNVLQMRLNNATQAKAQLERMQTDPHSAYYDKTVAQRLGMPTDTQSYWEKMIRQGQKEQLASQEGLSPVEKWINDLYISGIQSIPTTAAALIPGGQGGALAGLAAAARGLTLAGMGASAAGNRMTELQDAGYAFDKAYRDATISGIIEAGTEMIGVEKLASAAAGKVPQNALRAILEQGLAEGGEEALSYALNVGYNKLADLPGQEWNWKDFASQAAAGAVMGAVHMGAGVMINSLAASGTMRQEQTRQNYQTWQSSANRARSLLNDAKQWHTMIEQGAVSREEGQAALSQIGAQLNGGTEPVTRQWLARHEELLDIEENAIRGAITRQEARDQQSQILDQVTAQSRDSEANRMAAEWDEEERQTRAAQNAAVSARTRLDQRLEDWRWRQDEPISTSSYEEAVQKGQEAVQVAQEEKARRDAVAQLQAETPPITYERSGLPPTSFLGAAIDARREARARAEAEAQVRRDLEAARQNRVAVEAAPNAAPNTAPTVSQLSSNAETGQQTFVPNAPTQQQNVPVSYQNQQAQQPVSRLESLASTFGESGAASLRTIGGKMVTGQGAFVRDFTDVYNQVLGGRSENQVSRPAGMSDANYFAAVTAAQNDRQTGWDLDILKASKAAGRNVNAGVDWRDQYVRQMDRKTARTVDGLAKALGVKVVFAEEGSILTAGGERANAEITGNVVRIEKDNPNPVRMLIGHELTHRMQDVSPDTYRAFRDYAMSVPGSMDALERTVSLYQKAGAFRAQDNARQMAMDEVTADFAGSLLENSEQLQEFIRRNYENRTMLEVIRDFFRDLAIKLTGRERAQADEAVRLLEEAIKGASARVKETGKAEKWNKNTAREGGVKKLFSLSAPVEETDRFIASHNLNAEKMRGALELGGLAMPSVAMTPANIAHTGYGDITVVFGKDSVNPKDKRNQIFSDDAYTPTVPAAGYKISSDVTKRLRERIDALLEGLPSDLRSKVALDTDNIRDNIHRWGEDFGKVYGDNIALKTAYLIDQGENIKVPMRYEATRSGMDKATLRKAIRMFGDMDKLNSADKLDAFIEPARELERQYYREKFSKNPELADTLVKNFGWSDVDKLRNDAQYLKRHGDLRKITDLDALGKTVSRKLGTKKKQAAFEDWLRRESEGIIEKKGIRNDKDIFTRTGNRRSFEQLYDDYNLANIVKAMQQDVKQGKVGFLTGSGNIRGAAAKTYGSIEDARKEIGRIRETGEDEDFTAQYKAFDQRCRDLCAEMTDGTSLAAWDAAEALTETLAKHKTEPAIYRYLMKEWGSDGYLNVTPEIAQEAAELIKEAQKLPIHYMEAKLYRAVDLTEPLAYVVPSNLDKDLKQQMKDAGLPMKTYKAGDREDRLNKVNAVKGARFSITPQTDADYMAAVERGDMETAQRMVDEVAKAALASGKTFTLVDDDGITSYKLHRGPAPKKTMIVYKTFNVDENGAVTATYAGVDQPMPKGVWLDAVAQEYVVGADGNKYIPGKTGTAPKLAGLRAPSYYGFPQYSSWLSYRPAFHASTVPAPLQMRINDPVTKKKTALPHNKLIFKVEVSADRNYQEEAKTAAKAETARRRKYWQENQEYREAKREADLAAAEKRAKKNGEDFDREAWLRKYDSKGVKVVPAARDQLDRIPEMGLYTYSNQGEAWVLAGSFRILGVVSEDEVRRVNAEHGIPNSGKTEMNWIGGYHPEEFGLGDLVLDGDEKPAVGDPRYQQMKLADPVTYDDNGNVIPLSERFNAENQDIRYSLSGVDNVVAFPQNGRRSDAGMSEAMRDEEQGKKLEAEIREIEDRLEFAEFDDDLSETELRRMRNRLFKARAELDKINAKESGLAKKTSIDEILDSLDLYRRVDLESLANQVSQYAWDDLDEMSDDDLRDALRDVLEERKGDLSPLEAQAAKYGFSVRPPERYSLGTEGYDRARLMRENQDIRDRLETWRSGQDRAGQTKVSDKTISELTARLANEYRTDMHRDEIAAGIRKIYDSLGKGSSFDKVYQDANALAARMVEQASDEEESLYTAYQDLRSYIRGAEILVSKDLKDQIPGYNALRQSMMGRATLKNGEETNIDTVFSDLAGQWPEFFDPEIDTTQAAKLERIGEVLQDIYNREETEAPGLPEGYLATEILASYFDSPAVRASMAQKAGARSEAMRARHKERYDAALEKARAQKDKELKRKSERYLTAKRKRSQQQKERELRAKIQRHVKKLSTKLRTPTDTQHIPEDLIPTVRTALESINLASKDMKDTKRTQAFEALRKMYQEMDTNGSEVVIDPDLLPNISDIIGFADTPIANLGLEDLNTIWQTVRAIEASISTFNKALGRAKFETISQPAFGIRDYLRGRKDRGDYRGPIRAFDKLMNFGMLTPEQFFSRLGQDGKDIFKMLRSAQDHHITIMQNAQEWANKLIKGSRVKQLETEMKTFDFDGQSVTLSTAQIMSLYELMKRQQAIDHIMVGGVRPESVKRGIKERTPSEPWRLTQDQIGEIVGSLTEEEVKLADEMQGYMEKVLAELGNEASMEVYGYRKFTEKHYFPISVDKNQTQSDVKNDAVSGTIAGWGSARPVKPNANNAVILRSIFDVYADHTTEMANYAAWLAPMENLNRIFNFRYKNEAGDLEGGVKTMLERAFGKNGPSYWKQLQEDLNNGVHGRNDNPFQTLIGAYKGSAIGANIRVIAQQPTAILRALDEINPADFVAGVALSKPGKFNNVVMKYAPIAVWKNWGYFTADTGRQMRNVLFNDDSGVQKLNNFLMQGAGTADSVAWTHIWNAVEVETRRKRKDLEPGSEAFYEVVAERFGDIIDRTQVVDGILQRSQIMRSPDNLTKMATSFMAEPTKVYNMMTGALYDVRNATGAERSKAMRKLARTSVALLASFVANAAAQSLVDALRDDDKDEEYWQKFLQAFWGGEGESRGEKIKDAILNGNVEAAFNPATYIPWAKDIVSLTQGFNVSRMDMDTISRVVKEIGNTMRAMNGEGKLTKQNAVLRLSVEMARFLGIPASNLKRDIMSGMWTFYNETHNYRQLYEMERFLYDPTASNNQKEFVKILFAAQQAGDQDAYQHIRQDLIDSGIPEDKLDKKLSTMMKDEMSEGGKMEEQYNRVYDAYEEIMKASPGYQGLDAEQQEKVQTSLANYAKAKAIAEASGEEFATEDNEMNAIQKAEAAGVDPVTWKSFRAYTASLKGTGKIKEPAEAWLNKNGITGAQYDYCMEHYS